MFQIAFKKVEGSDYVEIVAEKGKAKLHMLCFGDTIDVVRSVAGKRSALAGPMGKVFWSWEDVCGHYKQFKEMLVQEAELVDGYLGSLRALKDAKYILKK
jgi:hypothetical protein